MRLTVRDTCLFFDVEGAKLVADGPTLREKPTLILLHGGPGFDHSGFKPDFGIFANVAQVIYLDHRGNGRSDRDSPAGWNLADWADDLRAFCDTLEIEKPIVLGHSFGGMVAMAYATRHPDHPGGIILSSTSATLRLDRILTAFARLGGPEARQAAEAFWTDPTAETLPEYGRLCLPLYSRTHSNPDADARITWNLDVLYSFGSGEEQRSTLLSDLSQIRCRTLILAGEDDPVTPVDDSRDIFAAIPDGLAQLETFAGCGHGVFRDNPTAAFATIRRFLLSEE